MSLVDALLLIASTDRAIRFLIFEDIYDLPCDQAVREIDSRDSRFRHSSGRASWWPSLRQASEAIRGGEIVCIFAEGQITRIGQLLPFRRGLERIMKGVDAPIVPVSLDGVWGSIFSFEKGRFLVEIAAAISVSGDGELREAAAADGDAVRSAPGCAGIAERRVSIPQGDGCGRCAIA